MISCSSTMRRLNRTPRFGSMSDAAAPASPRLRVTLRIAAFSGRGRHVESCSAPCNRAGRGSQRRSFRQGRPLCASLALAVVKGRDRDVAWRALGAGGGVRNAVRYRVRARFPVETGADHCTVSGGWRRRCAWPDRSGGAAGKARSAGDHREQARRGRHHRRRVRPSTSRRTAIRC